MVNKAIIEITLIPEALEKFPKEIEKEILRELRHNFINIPWCNRIEKVKVIEARRKKQFNNQHYLSFN
ncbi:MAG: hypothetical protein QXL77_08075 [Candidatus Bathyarchaeia archaeon]